MSLIPAEAENEKRVDGSETEPPLAGRAPRPRNVVEQPLELGRREIGVDHQARALADERLVSLPHEFLAARGGAAVLPDDGARHRTAGLSLPERRRLALVGDSDGD